MHIKQIQYKRINISYTVYVGARGKATYTLEFPTKGGKVNTFSRNSHCERECEFKTL